MAGGVVGVWRLARPRTECQSVTGLGAGDHRLTAPGPSVRRPARERAWACHA